MGSCSRVALILMIPFLAESFPVVELRNSWTFLTLPAGPTTIFLSWSPNSGNYTAGDAAEVRLVRRTRLNVTDGAGVLFCDSRINDTSLVPCNPATTALHKHVIRTTVRRAGISYFAVTSLWPTPSLNLSVVWCLHSCPADVTSDSCGDECSGRGACQSGTCSCDLPFSGSEFGNCSGSDSGAENSSSSRPTRSSSSTPKSGSSVPGDFEKLTADVWTEGALVADGGKSTVKVYSFQGTGTAEVVLLRHQRFERSDSVALMCNDSWVNVGERSANCHVSSSGKHRMKVESKWGVFTTRYVAVQVKGTESFTYAIRFCQKQCDVTPDCRDECSGMGGCKIGSTSGCQCDSGKTCASNVVASSSSGGGRGKNPTDWLWIVLGSAGIVVGLLVVSLVVVSCVRLGRRRRNLGGRRYEAVAADLMQEQEPRYGIAEPASAPRIAPPTYAPGEGRESGELQMYPTLERTARPPNYTPVALGLPETPAHPEKPRKKV